MGQHSPFIPMKQNGVPNIQWKQWTFDVTHRAHKIT